MRIHEENIKGRKGRKLNHTLGVGEWLLFAFEQYGPDVRMGDLNLGHGTRHGCKGRQQLIASVIDQNDPYGGYLKDINSYADTGQ